MNQCTVSLDVLLQKAMGRHSDGDIQEAADIYRQILDLDPAFVKARHMYAVLLMQQNKLDDAKIALQSVLSIEPNHFHAREHLAVVQMEMGQHHEAARLYAMLLSKQPDNETFFINRTLCLARSGDIDSALKLSEEANESSPGNVGFANLRAELLTNIDDINAAIIVLRRTIQYNSTDSSLRNHLSILLMREECFSQAISELKYLIKIDPSKAEYHYQLGICYEKTNQDQQCIDSLKKALAINPLYKDVAGLLMKRYMFTCSWDALVEFVPIMDKLNLEAIKQKDQPGEPVSINIARCDNPKANFELARAWSHVIEQNVQKKNKVPLFVDRKIYKKLTVAYVANNFNNHATSHLMHQMFALHDSEAFRVLVFSYGDVISDQDKYYYQIIEDSCDEVINIKDMAIDIVANKIREKRVDILVDLKGHTPSAVLELYALRPAPIQVMYLGFPGTSGATFFDYTIVDHVVAPTEHYKYYSESLVTLPYCYQVNSKQPIAQKPSREDVGLPEDACVFASFNQSYKITKEMFDCWLSILNEVPNSVLWLLKGNRLAAQQLSDYAKAHGIGDGRLIFAEMEYNKSKHLARLALVDIALDTEIWGGHTTTSDILWAGVPVLTKKGRHFASRVCTSILNTMGLSELVVSNLEEYKCLAVSLAHAPDDLQRLKNKVSLMRDSSPLFNTEQFVGFLELGYKKMWHAYLEGEMSKNIEIKE